jgi:hypothetical protein
VPWLQQRGKQFQALLLHALLPGGRSAAAKGSSLQNSISWPQQQRQCRRGMMSAVLAGDSFAHECSSSSCWRSAPPVLS